MKEWIIAGWVHLIIGWVSMYFGRPYIDKGVAWLTGKIEHK